MEQQGLELDVGAAWKEALDRWNSPSVPNVIVPRTEDEFGALGEVGAALRGELAFMKYPEFQTYLNLERIIETFSEDTQRGLSAVSKHEVGHRFCPYDTITTLILRHAIKTELQGMDIPYNVDEASGLILNLYTDSCLNTNLVRRGDQDIPWAYRELSREKSDSRLWRVYGKSMELAWGQSILPEDTELDEEETKASEELADLFRRDFFNKDKWKGRSKQYARVISKFLEDEERDKGTTLDDIAGNTPVHIDKGTAQELAKRLAEIGSDGLPTNPSGLEEFKEIMAGVEQGNPVEASITFYDVLSDSYDIMFATQPFGRPRTNPFQPVKWTPSMGADSLDVDYSVQVGGRIIPGVNTYSWNTRKREVHGGLEEVVPALHIYHDSSGTMPDPTEAISLPVLANFVVAKKAHRKGAPIKVTNFSGRGQYETQDWTQDLNAVFRTLVKHFGGGTVFPMDTLNDGRYPKQVLVTTDTFLHNRDEAVEAISEFIRGHKGNRVSIYALHSSAEADDLRAVGAQVIYGTNTDIFKRVIGRATEVYT